MPAPAAAAPSTLSETLIRWTTLDNWAGRNHQNLETMRERFDAPFI
jgi:hypothetical protein